jgi:hypothetical protein
VSQQEQHGHLKLAAEGCCSNQGSCSQKINKHHQSILQQAMLCTWGWHVRGFMRPHEPEAWRPKVPACGCTCGCLCIFFLHLCLCADPTPDEAWSDRWDTHCHTNCQQYSHCSSSKQQAALQPHSMVPSCTSSVSGSVVPAVQALLSLLGRCSTPAHCTFHTQLYMTHRRSYVRPSMCSYGMSRAVRDRDIAAA